MALKMQKPVGESLPEDVAQAEAQPQVKGELAVLLAAMDKDKGVKRWHKGTQVPLIERLPTGIFELDFGIGGGLPKNRLSMVYGPEGSGKSNLCMKVAANVQRLKHDCNKVVWVDLEHQFDPIWAAQFGLDLEELVVLKPSYGEEAVDMIDALVRADDVAYLVVDSIAVLTATRELAKSTESADVGTAAMLVKRLCNKLAFAFSGEEVRGHKPTVTFINQRRFKPGVTHGDPETIPGGETMKFLSSLTIRLNSSAKVDKSLHPDRPVYRETHVRVKKARCLVRQSEFDYDMALMDFNGLRPGETDSFKLVWALLKEQGHAEKVAGGWKVLGKVYPTIAPVNDTYYAEPAFQLLLQTKVLEGVKDQKMFAIAGDAT